MERPNQKHILVLITNPFAIINVIHSGLMRELGRFYKVFVMSDLLSETDVDRFNQHFHLNMHRLDIPVPAISKFSRCLRTVQMLLFGHYFDVETVRIKLLERGGIFHWLFRISRKSHTLTFLSGALMILIRNWLIRRTTVPGFYPPIAGYDLQAVISTSPLDLCENAVANSLKLFGIPCVSSIISWDNLTSKGVINTKSDTVLVWNERMALEYRRFYSVFGDNAEIGIAGVPRFDTYFRNRPNQTGHAKNLLGISPQTKVILFTTGAAKHHSCQNHIIRDLLEYAECHGDIMILVRCHPGDDVRRYDCFARNKNLRFFQPFDGNTNLIPSVDFLEMLHLQLSACHVCLQIASTTLLDAAACNKPCISIAYDAHPETKYARSVKRFYGYSHQLALPNRLKGRIVGDRKELFGELDSILTGGNPPIDLRDAIKSAIHQCTPDSVRSTTRHIREWLG